MKIIINTIICFSILILINGCSSKVVAKNDNNSNMVNPLGPSFGPPDDSDPLKLGENPTPPVEIQKDGTIMNPYLLDGSNLVPKIEQLPSNENNRVFSSNGVSGEYVGIMGAGGELVTVWALASGNWIWGYTHINSKPFGNARIWRIIEYPKNFVMFKNVRTGNCLTAYKNGVIHYPCNEGNKSQFWELIPMSNQAMLIKNLANGKCLQSPIGNPLGDFFKVFSIFTTTCIGPNTPNLDQQWYLITPTFGAKAIIIEK